MGQVLLLNRFLIVALLLLAGAGSAQTVSQGSVDPDLPSVLAESGSGIASRFRGLNAGATLTSVHDSAAGWYTLMTPALAYSFSPRYSLDLSMPVYLYRLAEFESTSSTISPNPSPNPLPPGESAPTEAYALAAHKFDPGDVFIAARANFARSRFSETLTPSMTLPSGDSGDGLSTGRVTFDMDSHSTFGLPGSALLLDLGGGDSSSLFNRLVTRNYTSLGYLAHFQLGFMLFLPQHGIFQSVAYEQLPLGDSKVYTTLSQSEYGHASPNVTVVSGRSVSEDNGFTNLLSIPLTAHLALQGYYNRSLRLKTDTVGMGIAFVARGRETHPKKLSYYDRLLMQ